MLILTMSKINNAYLLSHNGLGDNITMIGAIKFLLLHYKTIYFVCPDIYESNVKLLINNPDVNIITFNRKHDEKISCMNIINNVYSNEDTDIFICGCHKEYLKTKINNPAILNYEKNNKYDIKYSHIKAFYEDINLDLSIYCNYFDISSTDRSIELYKQIKDLKIIFCHTQASTKKISIPENILTQINNKEYIIICANENMYNMGHSYFEIANQFINIPVNEYIDVIKHAYQIFVIDSCFACIILPLSMANKLNTQKIEYRSR